MTLQEIEKYAKSIGLFGEFGEPFIGCLYMSFGEPHKSTVLYYPGEKRKIYISKTLIWRKSKTGHIYFESNDFPTDGRSHMMTDYYQSYMLSDNNGITKALNNLGIAYKRCLIEIKKADIKKDFEDDK
ncbi:MAG: hypothetical protein J6T74_05470 [Clostridia bacterium]|nr:hypothetical protein [Clostridia bacterium]